MINPFMLFIAVLALGFIIAEGWALVRWQEGCCFEASR